MEEAEVVERLREEAERTGDQDFSEAASLIERQQQVIDLLMKAVEPFSDAATIYDTAFLYQGDIGILPDSSDVSDLDARFTVGDLRRAREAKLEAEKILNSTPSTAL